MSFPHIAQDNQSIPLNHEILHDGEKLFAEEQFYNLLAGAGNHEAKLLTIAVIAASPDRYFTASNLYNELCDRQGMNISWRPHSEVAGKYARLSLEPVGAAVKGRVGGLRGPIDAYMATETGVEHGLPMAGALLAWSARYPEISLIQILGSTMTTSKIRCPEIRLKIYNEILTNPDSAVSVSDIANQISSMSNNDRLIRYQLNDLAISGIVDLKTVQLDYNPLIKIVDPEYRHVAIEFGNLKPETRAIYKAMEYFKDKGTFDITLDQLVLKASELEVDVDIHELRSKIPRALHGYAKNFPGLALLGRDGISESKRTAVSIKEHLIEPITELCELLEDIKMGNKLGMYRSLALKIINDPEIFSQLMGKVKRLSPNVIGQLEGREQLNKRILGVVQCLGRASIKDIRHELSLQGRPLSIEGIRKALEPLVEQQVVGFELSERTPTTKLKVGYYSLKDTDE